MAKTPTSKGKTSKKKAPAASSDGSPTIRLAGPDERLIRERAMESGSRKAGPMAGISRTGSAPTKSFSERPLRGQRPFCCFASTRNDLRHWIIDDRQPDAGLSSTSV
jgi:hypothetical protein